MSLARKLVWLMLAVILLAPSLWIIWIRVGPTAAAPTLDNFFHLRARLVAIVRGNRAVVAVFAHRDARGTLPETLGALDTEPAADPFTGQPFLYRRSDSGFTLYSAGVDSDDDKGAHHPRFGHRTWPPPRRRIATGRGFRVLAAAAER